MKRILAFLLNTALLLTLTACGGETASQVSGDLPKASETVSQQPQDERYAEGADPTEIPNKYAGTWCEADSSGFVKDGKKFEFFEDGRIVLNGTAEYRWKDYDGKKFQLYLNDEWVGAGYLMADILQNYDINFFVMETPEDSALLGYYLREGSSLEDAKVKGNVELTPDNWQEYFEFRPNTHGEIRDSFGEFERLDYVNIAMFLKEDKMDKVTKMIDVAIEYSFTDGYFCWYEYNFDTKELIQKGPAAEGEVDEWLKVNDSKRDLKITLHSVKDEDGCFLVFIYKHLSESVDGNVYTFIGEAYETMEITRITGSMVVAE